MPLLYALLSAWLTASVGALGFAFLFYRRLGTPASLETEPPVCVIAPVKGAGRHLAAFVTRLRGLAYADYRIVAVVESEDDPAYAALTALSGVEEGAPFLVLVAGLSDDEGQKVHNLRHALGHLHERDRIVAFIDADTLPSPDWLARLVRPLVREPDIAAVTGYRWIVPDDERLASAVVASANCSVLTGPRPWNVCWGGSLALRRETVEAIDLRARLAGAVVDDVQITRVLRQEGLRILSPRSLVVLSPAAHGWRSAAAFGRRQYQFMRLYLPSTWTVAVCLLTLPVAGGCAAVLMAATGDRIALAALATAVLVGQVRATIRGAISDRLWGADSAGHYRRQKVGDRWLTPVWATLHAACAIAAVGSRDILWSGTLYRVDGRNSTRVIRRAAG